MKPIAALASLCAATAGLLLTASTASATTLDGSTILAVDFADSAYTQSGWTSFYTTSTTQKYSQSVASLSSYTGDYAGGATVTLYGQTGSGAASINWKNRATVSGGGAFDYSNLFSNGAAYIAGDFVAGGSGSYLSPSAVANAATFGISGLAADTSYTIQIWCYDSSYGTNTTTTWYNLTGCTLDAGTGVLTGGTPVEIGSITETSHVSMTDDNEFSMTATVTSDANGNLFLGANSGASLFVNGFTLSDASAIPEPATCALLAGAAALAACVVLRRRRQDAGVFRAGPVPATDDGITPPAKA